MLTKIIRTLLGLPFVLMWWPIHILTISVGLLIIILPYWIANGKYYVFYSKDDGIAPTKEGIKKAITLPYQFIKKVWK